MPKKRFGVPRSPPLVVARRGDAPALFQWSKRDPLEQDLRSLGLDHDLPFADSEARRLADSGAVELHGHGVPLHGDHQGVPLADRFLGVVLAAEAEDVVPVWVAIGPEQPAARGKVANGPALLPVGAGFFSGGALIDFG